MQACNQPISASASHRFEWQSLTEVGEVHGVVHGQSNDQHDDHRHVDTQLEAHQQSRCKNPGDSRANGQDSQYGHEVVFRDEDKHHVRTCEVRTQRTYENQ